MDDSQKDTTVRTDDTSTKKAVRSVNTDSAPASGIQALAPELQKIIDARHHDPFSVLGKHNVAGTDIVRVFLPRASEVQLPAVNGTLQRVPNTDLFEWRGAADQLISPYQLKWTDDTGNEQSTHDPYSFLPQLQDFDLHLFAEGKHWHAYRMLG
ncbi:MAG: hypothetical protein AMJ55_05010, partial [Gammaproteobacteria bacterium SG8_15]